MPCARRTADFSCGVSRRLGGVSRRVESERFAGQGTCVFSLDKCRLAADKYGQEKVSDTLADWVGTTSVFDVWASEIHRRRPLARTLFEEDNALSGLFTVLERGRVGAAPRHTTLRIDGGTRSMPYPSPLSFSQRLIIFQSRVSPEVSTLAKKK